MQFLAPLFWLASIAVAVPIILHLTRKISKRPVLFPSLMFIRQLPVVEVRRRQLKHPLLLALRCLGILLLVAAFSRPVLDLFWVGPLSTGRNASTVILLDSSLSMGRPEIWSRAMKAATDEIEGMQLGQSASIVQFGVRTVQASPWEPSKERLLQTLQNQVHPLFEATDFAQGLGRAIEVLEESPTEVRRILLITDLQESGLGSRGFSELDIPEEVAVEIRDVGMEGPSVFIENVRLQREVFSDNYPFSIVVRIGASFPDQMGAAEESFSGAVQLYLEDTLVDRQEFQIEGEGSRTIRLDPFDLPEEQVKGRIVVDPGVGLVEDDVFYFVVERRQPLEVLLISRNDTIYFQKALSAGKNLPFRVIQESEIPNRIERDVPLVVLSGLPRISNSDLQAFVGEGGGLLLCLDNGADADAYNGSLGTWLPIRLMEKRFARSQGAAFFSVTELEAQHPVLEPFLQARENSLSSVQFYGYWLVEPGENSRTIARFSNGDPALVEFSQGKGKVLLFTSSLDRVWSDFPLKSAYVPFWQNAVDYTSQRIQRPSSMFVNQIFSTDDWVREETLDEPRRWDILNPQGQRLVGLSDETPESLTLEQPGHYELRRERKTDWLAVNVDRTESDLKRVSLDEFQSALSVARKELRAARTAAAISGDDGESETWWVLLLLAATVFLVESIIASNVGPRMRQVTS